MLNFTETAKTRVLTFLESQREQGVRALRLAGNAAEPKLWLVKDSDRNEGDAVIDTGSFEVFLDPNSAKSLEGATVDFVSNTMQSGFRVFFPSPSWDDPLAQRVQDVIDRQINPNVAMHGGRVSLIGVEENKAIITLEGGCQGCGSADVTLKHGIEVMIQEAVPEITDIIDATDHASGENPYYRASDQGDSPLTP